MARFLNIFHKKEPEFDDIRKNIRPFMKVLSAKYTPPEEIAELLYKRVSKFGVGEVDVLYSNQVDYGDINIQAEYEDIVDEDGREPIFITLIFNDYQSLKVAPCYLRGIENRIVDALEHELIHMQQARARDFIMQRDFVGENDEQNYLGNPDEIGAFAVNIASELLAAEFGNKEEVVNLLRNVTQTAKLKTRLGRLVSPNLYGYMEAWNWDLENKIIRKLLKKVYCHLVQG